jgi:hypothetical protein
MKQMYGCLITAVVIHCVLDTNLKTEITSSYPFLFFRLSVWQQHQRNKAPTMQEKHYQTHTSYPGQSLMSLLDLDSMFT